MLGPGRSGRIEPRSRKLIVRSGEHREQTQELRSLYPYYYGYGPSIGLSFSGGHFGGGRHFYVADATSVVGGTFIEEAGAAGKP